MRKKLLFAFLSTICLILIVFIYLNYKPVSCQVKRLCPIEYPKATLEAGKDRGLEFFYLYKSEESFETVKNYYDQKLPTPGYEVWSILQDEENMKTYNIRNRKSSRHTFITVE